MIKLFKKSATITLSIISIVFVFLPETFFDKYILFSKLSAETNIVINRILLFVGVFILVMIVSILYLNVRNSVRIKGHNYSIIVEYGDLLKMDNCKKVINFDECFTTSVGNLPANIKPNSICGQYLQKNPMIDVQSLINKIQLKPTKGKSKYQNKVRYESGKLVPNGDDLLLAFAKLDEDGLGRFFSLDEFLDCLSRLWKEIDKYYGQKDVCLPILGAGITRMNGASLTQQELLDIIIASYKLSPHKIKSPYKLRIVCQKCDGFSLNKIGEIA